MFPVNLNGRRDNVLNGVTRRLEGHEIGLIRHAGQCTPDWRNMARTFRGNLALAYQVKCSTWLVT